MININNKNEKCIAFRCNILQYTAVSVYFHVKKQIFTFHRHQMRAARIRRPKTKLTTMMKTFTAVEGFWVKRASTTTWKCTKYIIFDYWWHLQYTVDWFLVVTGVEVFYLCCRLFGDEDGVRTFFGIWHHRCALQPHDTMTTLRRRQILGVFNPFL